MSVNYDDKRFTEVKSQENSAIKELNRTYNNMISNSEKGYNDQIQASKDWVEKQTELQNENTDFAIEKIEQQKEQAEKDYIKEQSGAYADWQKQSNQYGAKAEQQASMGMANSGYSESSQVSMYNTYQNRVVAARESYSRAVLNYDNAINEAKLQNSSLLAEIAYQGLQEQLSLGIEAMQYKNSLLIQKSSEKRAINSDYHTRWMQLLSQINTEKAQAEQTRQFNAEMAFKQSQFKWQKEQANETSTLSGGSYGPIKPSSSKQPTAKEKQSYLVNTVKNAQEKAKNKTLLETAQGTKFKTYEQAAEWMSKNGVASGDGGLMTKIEWARRRGAGSGSAETRYSSYSDYLQAYVEYKVQNPEK